MRSHSEAIDELLEALNRLIVQAGDRARAARAGIEKHTFAPYHAYRAGIAEYQALVSVIEARLEGLPPDLIRRTRERLLASRQRVLKLSIRAAFQFFFQLSAIPSLPLGVREVFAQELQHLNSARLELRSPEHSGQLPADLERDLETAETILKEIMDKAPSLVSFDEQE